MLSPCARPRGRHHRGGSSRFFATALVTPVLTAHPTEVRRMSSIAREVEIARHLAERDRTLAIPAEDQAREEALRTSILTLWQTYILRRNRPRVIDEVSNALLYYETTFLRTLPQLYASSKISSGLAILPRASFRPSSASEVGSAEIATGTPS